MQDYIINRPVKVGRTLYKSGTESFNPKKVAALVANGALSETTAAAAPPLDPAAAFAEAVAKLDPAHKDHFTNDGEPELKALAAVGLKLKAAERSALWADYQAATAGNA